MIFKRWIRAMLYIKKDFIKKDSRMTWQNNHH